MKRRTHFTLCGLRPRAHALMITRDPFIIRMTYPCGYSQDVNVTDDANFKRIAPVLLVKWTTGERGYWTKAGGGVSDECPRCRRQARKLMRQTENTG